MFLKPHTQLEFNLVGIFTNAFENFEWSISSRLELSKLSSRETLLSKMNLHQITFFELRKLAMLVSLSLILIILLS